MTMANRRKLLQIFPDSRYPHCDLARHYASVFDERRNTILNLFVSDLATTGKTSLNPACLQSWWNKARTRKNTDNPDFLQRLLQCIHHFRVDCVICHDYNLLVSLARCRKPAEFDLLGIIDHFDPGDRVAGKLFSRTEKDNVYLLTTSHHLKKRILDAYPGIPQERIHTCYPGLNLNKLKIGQHEKQAARKQLHLRSSDFLIANLEPIDPCESQRSILEGLELTHLSCPGTGLVFMGSGCAQQSIALHARHLLLGDGIYFHDTHENCRLYLKAFDAIVWSCDRAEFDLQFLAAMASGIPVIAATGRGTAEELLQGPAWLFMEKDINQLAYQIRQVYTLSDPDRQSLKARMYSLLNQRFSARACRSAFVDSPMAKQIAISR